LTVGERGRAGSLRGRAGSPAAGEWPVRRLRSLTATIRWRDRPAFLADLVSRHRVFCWALGVGLLLRLIVMAGYRPAILVRQDSFDYLWDAVHLTPDPVRPDGYAFFLALLRPLHSLVLIAGLQHLMGLAIAVMVYALLSNRGVPGWGATLAAAPVLFDPRELNIEHSVMSDTLATLLMLAGLVVLLIRRPPSVWRPPSIAKSAVAGLLMGVAGLVRPITLPLFVLVAGYLLVQRAGWRRAVAALGAGALPLLGYALWFSTFYGSFNLTSSDGLFLWSRTMTFANCAAINPPADLRALCPGRQDMRHYIKPHKPNPFSALVAKLTPEDYLWNRKAWLWQPPAKYLVPDQYAFTPAKNTRAMSFSIRAIAAQPLGYSRAVAEDVALTFLNTDRSLPFPQLLNGPAILNYTYQVDAVEGYVGHRTPLASKQGTRVYQPYANIIHGYQSRVYFPGVMFALVLTAGLVGVLLRSRRSGAAMLLWASSAVMIVLPSAEHTYNYRYALPAVPLACMALALALNTRNGPRDGPRLRVSPWLRMPAQRRQETRPPAEVGHEEVGVGG
jgi:hypothetical protein